MQKTNIPEVPEEFHKRIKKLWKSVYKSWKNPNVIDEETFYAGCLSLSTYYDLMDMIKKQGSSFPINKGKGVKKNPLLEVAKGSLTSWLACCRALKIQSGVKKQAGQPSRYNVEE